MRRYARSATADGVGGVSKNAGRARGINPVQGVGQGCANEFTVAHRDDGAHGLYSLTLQTGLVGCGESATAQDVGDLLAQQTGAAGEELLIVVEPGNGLGPFRQALSGPARPGEHLARSESTV